MIILKIMITMPDESSVIRDGRPSEQWRINPGECGIFLNENDFSSEKRKLTVLGY